MKKNLMVIIVVVVIALLMFSNMKKEAGAGLDVTRTFSGTGWLGNNHVLAGSTVTATYHPATMNYFGLIESIPSGWSQDKSVSPDGKVRVTGDGANIVITWTAPASAGTASFTGQYFVYPDTTYTNLATQSLSVCTNHASSACSNGDVYWYTSCNDEQDVKQTCTANACTAYAANFCDVKTIKKSRTCYTSGCTSNACTNTPYTDTTIVTSAVNSASGVCAWSCTSGACDQNTAGDTNYNGCVADTEFPVAVSNWKLQTGGVTDLEFPSIVSKWKNQENC